MENDAEHNPCPSLLAKLIKMAIKFGIMKTKSVQSRSRSPAGKKPQTEHPAHGMPVPAPAPFGCPSAAAAATAAQEARPRPSSTGAITLPCSCCPSPVPWPAAAIPHGVRDASPGCMTKRVSLAACLCWSGSPFQPFGCGASLFYLQVNLEVICKLFWLY